MSLRDNTHYGSWDCPECHYSERLEEWDVDPRRPADKAKYCQICGAIMEKNEIHWGPDGPPKHGFNNDDLPVFPG